MKTAIAPDVPRHASHPVTKRNEAFFELAKLSFAPRFRGFQTTGRGRQPSRLSGVLRAIAARTGASDADGHRAPFALCSSSVRSALPLAAIARSVSAQRLQPGAEDRRRFLRRPSTHLVRVLPYRDVAVSQEDLEWALHESPFRGQMSDISMNGVAFVLTQPMTASARVWLKLESRTRDFAVVRSGRIVRVVPVSDTEWTITCRFDRSVPYADVAQLGQDLG